MVMEQYKKYLPFQTAILAASALVGYLIVFLINYGYLSYYHVPYGLVEFPRSDIYAGIALGIIAPSMLLLFDWIGKLSDKAMRLVLGLLKLKLPTRAVPVKSSMKLTTIFIIYALVIVVLSYLFGFYLAKSQRLFYSFDTKSGEMIVIRMYPDKILAKRADSFPNKRASSLYVFPSEPDADAGLELKQLSL
ncbi:MAG: hypothetical protein JWL75_654 [Parcubacteria group bacterium]|nr:hypothetical protein [Parcubacteria group bacterium]